MRFYLFILTVIFLNNFTISPGFAMEKDELSISNNRISNKRLAPDLDEANSLPTTKYQKLEEEKSLFLTLLPEEMRHYIFSFFEALDLNRVALSCTQLRAESYNAPMWCELMKKSNLSVTQTARTDFLNAVSKNSPSALIVFAKFFSDGKYIPVNANRAFKLYSTISAIKDLSLKMQQLTMIPKIGLCFNHYIDPKTFNHDPKFLIDLMKITHETTKPTKTHERIPILLHAILIVKNIPQQVRSYLENLSNSSIQETSFSPEEIQSISKELRENVLFSPGTPIDIFKIVRKYPEDSKFCTLADLYLSIMHVRDRRWVTGITDEEAFQLLTKASKNKEIAPYERAFADYYIASLGFNKRPPISEDEAFQYFTKVSQNTEALPISRIRADLNRAIMRVEDRTDFITYDEAFQLLTDIHKNNASSSEIRALAGLYRAMMKVEGKTNLLSDDETSRLLSEASENKEIYKKDQALADRYKKIMSFHLLSNEETNALFYSLERGRNHGKHTFEDFFYARLGVQQKHHRLQDKDAFEILTKISENSSIFFKERLLADYYRAILRFHMRTNLLSDKEAFLIFTEVSENDNAPSQERLEASVYRAALSGLRGNLPFDKQDAFLFLTKVSQDKNVSSRERALANLYKAMISVEGQTPLPSDNEDFQSLAALSKNNEIAPQERAYALYYIALLKFLNRTSAITDNEAADLFTQVCQNSEASPTTRIHANFFRGLMGLNQRTTLINNHEVYRIFTTLSENDEAPPIKRTEANLYRALLRFYNRTSALSDKDAFDLLHSVSQNMEVDPSTRATADLIKALLWAQKRINLLSSAEAFQLFKEVSENEQAPSEARKMASEFLKKLMEAQEPSPSVGLSRKLE